MYGTRNVYIKLMLSILAMLFLGFQIFPVQTINEKLWHKNMCLGETPIVRSFCMKAFAARIKLVFLKVNQSVANKEPRIPFGILEQIANH